ncbi:MAG: DnaD domain protein [Dehalococcoidia bacterium]|nr:DnaD domain protein [Dehalococcoidia bacterium]
MSDTRAFEGFPGIGRGTAIPNLFFEKALPQLQTNAALLAFLWVARIAQEQKGAAQCAAPNDIWEWPAAREAFEHLGGGAKGLQCGLDECVHLGVLLRLFALRSRLPRRGLLPQRPQSRRAIARARAGQLELRPGAAVAPAASPSRPDIFRLYESHIGTITPFMAERLAEAASVYPHDWIEDAFREAAERNVRNWRYVERILETWSREGQDDEATPGDPFESADRGYIGSAWSRPTRRS